MLEKDASLEADANLAKGRLWQASQSDETKRTSSRPSTRMDGTKTGKLRSKCGASGEKRMKKMCPPSFERCWAAKEETF